MLFLALLLVPSIFADCPPGSFYDDSFGKCYKYVSTPTTFLAAESACAGSGGNLITIGDGFENSFVIGMARGSGNVWIGLSYLVDNQFSWISGKNSSYRDWASGYPMNPSSQQCTNIRDTDNKWINEKCSAMHPFVCEIDPNAVPANCPTVAPTAAAPCSNVVCDTGYQLLTSTCKCYKFDSLLRTYTAAKVMCQSDGASLVKIENTDVNNFLLSLAGVTRTGPWIGIQCPTITVDTCTWPDGSTASSYSNFAPGNPKAGYSGAYLYDISQSDDNYGKWFSYSTTGTGTGGVFCMKDPRTVTAVLGSAKEERPSRLYRDLKREL